MADKSVGELIAAQSVTPTDLFVLEQNGTAKKLTGQILENWLVSFADGHGGIQNIVKIETNVLADTYRITLADTTTFDFVVTNGRGVNSITKKSTSGLVDTYTITYNDGTTGTFTVTNGAKGDKGDNQYVWIKYASQKPTASSHSFGDVADNWIGIYSGDSATAPTDWQMYTWFEIKGAKGDTGEPATVISNVVEYQASDSGTIIPSGAWGTSIPVVAQGRYLWARTITTFNTGSSAVSYSVSRMGIDGTGSVTSVAGISPNAGGNVPLTATDVGALPNTGGDLTGELRMNGQPISGLNEPTENDQAANMGFVNQRVRKAAPRNLLDNSYWENPSAVVNQRNNSYVTDKKNYPIDRWLYLYDGDTARGGAGYDSTNKYLYLINNSSASGNTMLFHRVPIEKLKPGKYTFAIRQAVTNLPVFMIAYINDAILKSATVSPNTDGIALYTFEITEIQTYLTLYIYAEANKTLTFSWAALYEGEYTLETLPEYQPKGYGVELLECQRYLQRFRTETERKTYCEDFRPTMRMTDNGVVSKFEQEIDGVTYYFASAEL